MRLLTLLLLLSALVAVPAVAGAAVAPARGGSSAVDPSLAALMPRERALYADGPRGRYLLDANWEYRADDADQGVARHFERDRGLAGWAPKSIPFNWNGADTTQDAPSVGWFRTQFVPPRNGRFMLRFESVNGRASVWLNGRLLGHHDGGYFPFELPARGVRPGVNRLVVRVDSHKASNDLAFWRRNSLGGSIAGWWNFGGIGREVYLRSVDHVDLSDVTAVPVVRCAATCTAALRVRARVLGAGSRGWHVGLSLRVAGQQIAFHPRWVARGSSRLFSTSVKVPRPRLWSPEHPSLYPVALRATVDDPAVRGRSVAGYDTHVGLRAITLGPDRRILLNGRPLLLHGASMHEDDPQVGAAWGPAQRARALDELRSLGANVVRAHYPLSPAFLEMCDRAGILVWDEVPVYQVPNQNFANLRLRAQAVRLNREIVARDHNHASVFAYSVGNELPAQIDGNQAAYLNAAIDAVRGADPTRLVADDRYADVNYGDYPVLHRFDLIGLNEYFGWYGGNSADVGYYLDRMHSIYPRQALVVTEFGAEANRDGPASEKGTYAFQQALLRAHLGSFAARSYLSGQLVWALKDFRVNPTWTGANPQPSPPWNKKGLVHQWGEAKPAFADVAAIYHAIHDGQWPVGVASAAPRRHAQSQTQSRPAPRRSDGGGYVPGP